MAGQKPGRINGTPLAARFVRREEPKAALSNPHKHRISIQQPAALDIMPNYAYVALDAHGHETRGALLVNNQSEALRRIKEMGFFPTKVIQETQRLAGGRSARSSGQETRVRVCSRCVWPCPDTSHAPSIGRS